jgi:hypothetical protein
LTVVLFNEKRQIQIFWKMDDSDSSPGLQSNMPKERLEQYFQEYQSPGGEHIFRPYIPHLEHFTWQSLKDMACTEARWKNVTSANTRGRD